jgi:hypothetical protein
MLNFPLFVDCNDSDKDECGVCNGNGTASGACDCDGNVLDECGSCGGTGIASGSCDCDGNVLDECGNCTGTGIASGACDCDGNVLDECGNCGGDGSNCRCPALTPDTVYTLVGESTLEKWFSVGGVYDFGECAIADFADGHSCVLSCHPGYTPNPVFCDAKEGGWVIPEDGCIAIADDKDEGCPAISFENADGLIPLEFLQDWFGSGTVESFGECAIADSSIGGSCVLECAEGFKPSAPLHCGEDGWIVDDAGCEPDVDLSDQQD